MLKIIAVTQYTVKCVNNYQFFFYISGKNYTYQKEVVRGNIETDWVVGQICRLIDENANRTPENRNLEKT